MTAAALADGAQSLTTDRAADGAERPWQNRVPKAERQESLQAHLRWLVHRTARTEAWRRIGLEPLCLELERRIEEQYPDKDEEFISARCHKRLRKLGNALRAGWELELLGRVGPKPAAAGPVDYAAIFDLLGTLGAEKQEAYRHIKAGDRAGAAALMRTDDEGEPVPLPQEVAPLETSRSEYSTAVAAQRNAMWHRQAMAAVVDQFKAIGAERIIDIGSSFNPLQAHFPHVTALDAVPQDPSVLITDFLKVDIVDGLTAVRTDPSEPGRCVAVPGGLYDGGLLSLVLRSLRSVADRRLIVQRAAQTIRPGGLLLVVEKNKLGSLIKYQGPEDRPWEEAGLRRRKTINLMRAVLVNVFERQEGEVVQA